MGTRIHIAGAEKKKFLRTHIEQTFHEMWWMNSAQKKTIRVYILTSPLNVYMGGFPAGIRLITTDFRLSENTRMYMYGVVHSYATCTYMLYMVMPHVINRTERDSGMRNVQFMGVTCNLNFRERVRDTCSRHRSALLLRGLPWFWNFCGNSNIYLTMQITELLTNAICFFSLSEGAGTLSSICYRFIDTIFYEPNPLRDNHHFLINS